MFKHILILNGEVTVKGIPKPTFKWTGPVDEDRELVFEKAYEIVKTNFDKGIENCVYRVYNREFKDLSCMVGETLQEFPDHYELREHADGTKFIFTYSSIPTFDLGDRVWDSMRHIAVYRDDNGIHMIHCRHGYKIPRLGVYIGLSKSIPTFTKWLRILGCEDSIIERVEQRVIEEETS